MKTVMVEATWRTLHVFEVDDGGQVPDVLDGFTTEQLEQMTSQNAELVDWSGS